MTSFDERADRIAVLSEDLANQIAAGEVVERPASVVKELCENAIDADAARVDVEIASGGVVLTKVSDDGWGMSERDARMAVLRHATSKIATADDLERIASFGFRGEALPSIASVSRLRIETRRRGDDRGTAVVLEGGGEPRVEPCGAPVGTMVEVRDLFFNVPARRKFLRALPTESAHVTEVVESLALSHPTITFTLTRDGRRVREHLRAPDRETRVRDVLSGEDLARCSGERGPMRVEAYLSKPERARSGAGSLSLFVNRRPVKDRALARAVAHAYGSVLEPGRYPIGVVYVELPLASVDVNVHPQKAEVRFADGRAVGDALFRVLEGELARAFQIERSGRPGAFGRPSATPRTWPEPERVQHVAWSGSGRAEPPVSLAATLEAAAPSPIAYADVLSRRGESEGNAHEATSYDGLRFVAQVRATYLVCESEDAIVLVDQHAAAERVTFDRLKRQLRSRSVARQGLLIPEVVPLAPREVAIFEEAHAEVLAMGLDVRASSHDSVTIHAVPQLLARASPEVLVRDLVAELGRRGDRGISASIDLALATMACHGSLRAGERIADEEARALLRALAEVDFGGHCPHGRPIVTRLSFRELEHRVGRR